MGKNITEKDCRKVWHGPNYPYGCDGDTMQEIYYSHPGQKKLYVKTIIRDSNGTIMRETWKRSSITISQLLSRTYRQQK